ncbi:hypothetical protein F5Y04DRAFT_241344 [Hypomontagnella monticulosa]|nr:hypothetical protein F5Y04DRAFT_241344 [Hypomontagnella monticulosa]
MATIWRRACVGCTKSKRQCTKSVPACRRCQDRGIPCEYPPPRRTLLSAGAAPATPSPSTPEVPANPPPAGNANASTSSNDAGLDFPPLQLSQSDLGGGNLRCRPAVVPDSPHCGFDDNDPDSANTALPVSWFLAPESWIADYTLPPNQPGTEQLLMLQRFTDSVQRWLRQWVTEGSSPLHHRFLYRQKMPRYVQDAYTAVSMYHAAAARESGGSADARATAIRVMDDRVTQLLEDQALEASLCRVSGREMDVFDHLSRVQALLTYQTIRLLDGDIQMRAQAESLVPTLFLWTRQLLDSAKENLTKPTRLLANHVSGFGSDSEDDVVWRAWILVESVRRTWLVANYLQEIYLYLKRGWGECPGRVTITMRTGLWDAPSPYAWTRACRDGGTLFLPTAHTERLFYEKCPADVDEFSMLIVELSYGAERIERWLGESKGREERAERALLDRLDETMVS